MSQSVADLPDLSSDYPLSAEQIAGFQRDGHTVLRGVCSPEEIAVYRQILSDATYRYSTETRPLEERDTYGKAFLQITNLWARKGEDAVRKFVLARRFARIAAELMGVDGVRLYHDQALYKEAGGGHTPWHQDQYYWPLDTNNTVTMWMPLVDCSLEMGPITFASGSHKQGFLGHLAISDESHETWDRLVKEKGFPVVNHAMRAGDATFHYGWTLHCAPGNASPTNREVMTVIYFADGTRIMQNPDNPNRWADLQAWHPGVEPGELAASGLNPLLYHK
ncbi:MAG TPA: phytanoyl-CoA dioxygenase family protein [Chthonomonadaceae bacterium]|nr:phytanoyl-CoA dioxygenase family protein [Chthonomonadaceae bacterium]